MQLCGQLRLRLQYAKLKVEHGWQRQTLNEVENLYFRHTHKSRPHTTPMPGGRRSAASTSVRYTPNTLFPINEYRHDHDTASEQNAQHQHDGERSYLEPAVGSGSVSIGIDEVAPSTQKIISSPTPPAETQVSPTAHVQRPHSVQSGPDSGTLEQAAASMFSPPQPVVAEHTAYQVSTAGMAAPTVPDAASHPPSNGVIPEHVQFAHMPYSRSEPSFYQPSQDSFYPAQTPSFQFEFHYHTPHPMAPPPPHDYSQPQLPPPHVPPQTPPESPQSHRPQQGTFRPIAPATQPAQASAPANPTLTYDAFWSSHSSSTQYRHVLFNSSGSPYQSAGVPTANGRPAYGGTNGFPAGGIPVSAPMPTSGLSDVAAIHAAPTRDA
ncbi:uncharacterized protein B0H18DRAFT_69963 [Fomitopsis serialis]|uniref:uncharacterized protein n=1 Tax=Fomitopsis serialis TaxID=139415 RepID=UPI002008D6B1|nr:uncharacterized protein B0H18DRAFT_69963 [Neoantrodia serialis]KAH9931908.1 hypothetical protein B0H18DRAFT_69963 [Neoantrodia serialis]